MNTIVEHINSAGFSFVEFAVPMLVQSCVLIVILLLADLLLRKKVKAVFRYWIWMLVLVKLVLPTSLSSPLSLGYLFGDKLTYQELTETTSALELAERAPAETLPGINPLYIQPNPYVPLKGLVTPNLESAISEPVSTPAAPVTPLSWQGVVFLVWLVVVMAMGLLLLQRALFVRGLVAQAKKASRLMNDELAYCCASMRIKCRVGLKVSPNATTPSVCGLIRPVILVPWNLVSTLGASRLRTVLMHELAHIRRADLWVNLAQTVLQIIYFYNPLLWVANCVIRRIREQAVDEAVLVAMGGKARQYPQMLVDVAKMAFKRPALSLRLIGVVESKSALAGRIKHILGRPMPRSAKLGIISILAIIIAGAILLPMAKARNEDRFSDKDLLIKFAELPEGAAKKVSVGDTTIWSKSYEVEFAPGQDLLVVVEMYQAGKPMWIPGQYIFEGSEKPGKFTVTFDRTYQDAAKRSVTHNIQFKLGDKVFKIPVHTPRYLSTQWWDWYRGEGLRRPEMRYTKTKYAGIETLFYYGAANLSMESEYKAKFWIPGRDVTPAMNQYGIALKMIPLSSLKYLSVEPIGGYQGLDGKIISRSLTLEKADNIADEYKQMIIDSVEKQWTPEKQAEPETAVQVEGEEAAAVSTESEVGLVPIVQAVQNKATLPNGVTVELVGLCEHPSEGKQWWRPDGTLWEDRPYEEFSSHNSTSGEKEYELVWRLSSDEDVVYEVESADQGGSAGRDVLHNERGLRPALRSGEFYGVILFFSPRLSQAAIRIGVGLDRNWKTIASLEGDVSKAVSSINNVVLYPAIEADGRIYIDAAYRFPEGKGHAYRLVAVDTSNKQHIMQQGSETKGRGSIHCRKQIDLPLKQIKTIHFQTRPLQWVTFENVSLRPGIKTDVQVEVEESEPVSADVIEAARAGISLPVRKVFSGKSDKGGSFEWETSIDPRVRFRHGWYSVVDDGVKEHIGGASRNPEKGRINLKLDVEVKDNMLNLKVQRVHDSANGRTEAVASKTTVPAGAYLKHDSSIDSDVLTNKHLTLWRGDFIRDDKVVKSVIYAAYLTTPDDRETGFKPPVLQKKEFVTAKVKSDVQVEVERGKDTSAKERIEFFGLDLTDAPRTTKWADLLDLFEERPPSSKSYQIHEDVTAVYSGLDGTVYYIPEKEIFYIQHDKLGSSTLTYYGPFKGDPHQVLGLEKDVPVDVGGAGKKVSRFIGVDLPASVQNVKFHTGSFDVSSKAWIKFDIPLSDLKNLLAKSDKLPGFPDLHKNPKIQKDMDEVYKDFNIEWWKSDELENPVCAAWIKSERAKGAPKVWVVNILNICCSQLENNLMRVYISLYSHAH